MKATIRKFFNQFTDEFDDIELKEPDYLTILKLIWHVVKSLFKERPGQIIGSTFILLMIWGYHGELELVKLFWKGWVAPGTPPSERIPIIPWIPWDYEIISFFAGAFLLVIIPIILIKSFYKLPLFNFGLGLPPKGRRVFALWTFIVLTTICLPVFYFGAQDESMQRVYPIFKSFSSSRQFILYELTYLPFFIAIEFIFRGYLLFGLAGVRDNENKNSGGGAPGVFYFSKYALLIQMLSYTAWHLGKPIPELWGTIVWGLAAGILAYASRSIWPVILSHWLLNVFIDAVIIKPF